MENEEILNKIEVVKSYVDSQYEFTKECIRKNLDLDINTDSLNSKLKAIKSIKEKIELVFKDELEIIEENKIDNLPGFEEELTED